MTNNIIVSGNTENPIKALIMLHGRGSSAKDIVGLVEYLNVEGFLLICPEARQNTWYPNSFMASIGTNQPQLDQALESVENAVLTALEKGIKASDIYFLGFSQGACLTLEYTARNAKKYGGIIAFTGGLIGDTLNLDNYSGNFENTPVFIGTSDPDFHVPVNRVNESTKIFQSMNANVDERIYKDMEHTITQEEIDVVNTTILK